MEINQNSAVTLTKKKKKLTDVKLKQNIKLNKVGNGIVDRCVGYPKTSVVIYTKASGQVWGNIRSN